MKTKFLRGKIELKKLGDVITVVASDESLDRHGDVLPIENWDLSKFIRSPRMLVDHNHEVASIVGKWTNVRIEGKKLLMDADFHGITELSKAVQEMVQKDYLDTVSVGFISHGPTRDGGSDSFELIETSWVTVPANPNARVELAMKSALEKTTDEEKKSIKSFVGDDELESSDDIIPDETDEDEPEPTIITEPVIDDEKDFNKVNPEVKEVKITYRLFKKLIEDSEKLQTLTIADKADVDKALRTAKIMKLAFKEAAHVVSDALRQLNK